MERIAYRLIQTTMRAVLPILLLLVSLLGVISPANATTPTALETVSGWEEGCASAFQADCKVCEPQSPAASSAKQSSAKSLATGTSFVHPTTPAAIAGAAWSPLAATGAGPPAYLIFHRFLL